MAKKIIGIDLGTTNSVVAIMEGRDPKVIENEEGNRLTPSVVGFSKDGEILVGQVARRQAITNPENTVYSIKRFMGRKFEETTSEQKRVPYRVVKGDNGDAAVEIQGKKWSPPEISAKVLQKLKRAAENYLGEGVSEAVITVPAYFNDAQRQATKDAGRIAGLEVRRIINEPTAAALAYGLDKKKDEIVAVFDYGGGTFDISILEVGENVVEVVATNGDTHLGGDDMDQKIMDWLIQEFRGETGIDVSKDKMVLQRLKEASEKAKIELSSTMETEINLPFLTADQTGPKHLVKRLTRAKFEQMCEDLFQRALEPTKKCLADSKKSPKESDNRTLGRFHLDGIPPAPRGVPQIEVTFDIDANGIVHVMAKDRATGKENKITITASSGLSKEDVDRAVKEAQAHEAEDKERREEIEVRNRADNLAYATEKSLKELGDKIPAATRSDLESKVKAVRDALNGSDVAAVKSATETLMQASHRMAEEAYKAAGGAQGGPGAPGPETGSQPGEQAGGPKKDDVVDAEFEEQK